MGYVIIDYKKFKEILKDIFTDEVIDELIGSMNDNDVFINILE